MNLKILLLILFFVSFQIGCTEKKSQETLQQSTDSAQQHSFFPVTAYILGQLKEIDSLPVTPLKITGSNSKQDSIWMKKNDIRPFAEPFLHPEIDSISFKKFFSEKSFLDQTINAVTLSYDPIDKLPDSIQVRHWDVYIDPEKGTVKRIYIVREIKTDGGLKTLQLTWKSNQWCKITTITQHTSNSSDIKEETMKWDFNE